MSKYTAELGELIENGVDIGLKSYPIWYEEYREELNKKIIDHYYFREIGFETVGRFIHALNTKMNEIMPYYIKLYETTLLKYDPLEVVNYKEEYTLNRDNSKDTSSTLDNTETGKSVGNGTVKGNSKVDSNVQTTLNDNSKNVENDTPQSPLPTESIDNFTHASKITYNKNDSTNNQDSHSTSEDNTTTTTNSDLTNTLESKASNNEKELQVETMTKHIKGNYTSTSYQALIQKEREIILNIDLKIINDLQELFMSIW